VDAEAAGIGADVVLGIAEGGDEGHFEALQELFQFLEHCFWQENCPDKIDLRAVRTIAYETAKPIADKVIELFENGEFDVCTLFYSRFKSVISQIPTAQQLIPPELGAKDENAPAYEYEPDEGEILAQLLPRAVAVRIYRALLENQASFFGAQMTAMDNATRNAGDMVKRYTLRYNRTRQAMITKELIEIISGAEAL